MGEQKEHGSFMTWNTDRVAKVCNGLQVNKAAVRPQKVWERHRRHTLRLFLERPQDSIGPRV